jgi:pimeloyl-ACP methyl ester carboxylesterase
MRRQVRVGGGRLLAFEARGPSDGSPVFLLHGTPGSRLGPRLRSLELDLMGIRLITFDRPGYGDSTRLPGRRVADAANDVEAIADDLGLERFAVVGRSGGAPHALACGALLGDNVIAVASLVGLAPRNADGLDWFEGMGEGNFREHRAAWDAIDRDELPLLARRLSHHTDVLGDPTSDFLRRTHDADMPMADKEVMADAGIRHLLAMNFKEAAAGKEALPADDGVVEQVEFLPGWLDDTVAFSRDWGFKVDEIDCPVLLWHGEQDVFSPVSHSRWLAARIGGNARLIVDPVAAHFGALNVLPDVLRWVSRPDLLTD